ncbi:hypothetical protein BTVI_37418 [Pitangus sulphuratus]|nr:hypothetical protein BTVI_37418 [Pitangus sulphuratus]
MKERKEVLWMLEHRFPYSLLRKTVMKLVVPLQPMKVPRGVDIHHAGHAGPHARADRCSLKEAAVHGEAMWKQDPGLWSEKPTLEHDSWLDM